MSRRKALLLLATRFVPFYRRSAFTIESCNIHASTRVLMYEHRPSIKLRGRANHFSRALPSKSVSPRVISLLHARNQSIDRSWFVAANCESLARISPWWLIVLETTPPSIDLSLLNFNAMFKKENLKLLCSDRRGNNFGKDKSVFTLKHETN